MLTFAIYIAATWPAIKWVGLEVRPGILLAAILSMFVGMFWLFVRFGSPRSIPDWRAVCIIVACAWFCRFSFNILQQLSVCFALFGLYGFAQSLSGLNDQQWRQGLIMAALAALALPFALVPGTGAGFYLRLLSADASAFILGFMGHNSLGAHDVLIFDNGIAQVDIPCSGLKSLFTGTAFFLAASLVVRRAISVRWLLAYGFFIGLLLAANIARVTSLIWISEILGNRLMADQVHTPIGLGLFTLCCLAGGMLLMKTRSYSRGQTNIKPSGSRLALPILLAGIVGSVFLFPLQNVNWDETIPSPNLEVMTDIGLTPTEIQFFAARGRTNARKWQFEYEDLSGSMLVVKSRAANGLHAPEVCLLGNGLTIEDMQSVNWDGSNKFRWLSVNANQLSAAYWMQSGDLVTDDFRTRLSQYILGRHNEWIMVTILFDQSLSSDTFADNNAPPARLIAELRQFYKRPVKDERS